jgi:hypothetical protein
MAGKFLRRGAIVDLVKSEQRTNAVRKRKRLQKHPVTGFSCGCPDPSCGGWYAIQTDRTIPTAEESKQLLAEDKQSRKHRKSRPKARKTRSAKRRTG